MIANAILDIHKLTDAERSLMTVMTDPSKIHFTVKEICEKAGVSRNTYYKAIKKKPFINEYKKRSAELVDSDIGEVVKALLKEAKKGSAKHIQIALEMSGLYSKNINVNQQSVSITLDGKDIKNMSDATLIEVAKKYGITDE